MCTVVSSLTSINTVRMFKREDLGREIGPDFLLDSTFEQLFATTAVEAFKMYCGNLFAS